MDTPKKKKLAHLRRILPLLFIFAAGVITGYSLSTIKQARITPPQRTPHVPGEGTLNKLTSELALSPEQVEEVKVIMKDTFEKLATIRQDAMPLIQAQVEQMDKDIREVLSEQQQEKWTQHFERVKRMLTHPERGRFRGRQQRDGERRGERGDGPREGRPPREPNIGGPGEHPSQDYNRQRPEPAPEDTRRPQQPPGSGGPTSPQAPVSGE